MSIEEVGWRLSDYTRQRAWTRHQVKPGAPWPPFGFSPQGFGAGPILRRFTATLPVEALDSVPDGPRRAVVAAADQIASGRWAVLGVGREDIYTPDWFVDPVTGRRAPQDDYCFSIDHRDVRVTGNIKQVWELSRFHHATVLAAAFALTRDEKYAAQVDRHLRSWWKENPFLSGVHWTSGIELGVRLISWVWVRRLLDGWHGAAALFEQNDDAAAQIWWHQHYLDKFRSRGSSANNHVIAEAAGQLVAALAFDWFDDSPRWADRAASLLEEELLNNTFPSGVNREMAFDYHGFVAELAFLAAAEADRADHSGCPQIWGVLCRMLEVVASVVDVRLQAPRQGDSDDGFALVIGPQDANRWASLLALGSAVFGAADWWPQTQPDVMSTLVASLAGRHPQPGRPAGRASHYDDAGLTILRSSADDGPEIWCRCDAGPHGFLSIAAHAHADALSIEVRHRGIEILADPGTYCYGGEPDWRSYFKSTLGHNTVEIAGRDQSTAGGSTLWIRSAESRCLELGYDDGDATYWSAEHDGYLVLDPPVRHQRSVRLLSAQRRIEVVDQIRTDGRHPLRMAFHFGPTVDADLREGNVHLSWIDEETGPCSALLRLPPGLDWSLARGSTDPVLGWYSRGFGQKEPTTAVVGEGVCGRNDRLETHVQFAPQAPTDPRQELLSVSGAAGQTIGRPSA